MIDTWLHNFKQSWLDKDLETVLSLFSDDVIYWETPHKRLNSKKEILAEWQAVLQQHSIVLKLSVYSSIHSKHTVLWELSYLDDNESKYECAGVYLVELNQKGQCHYFYQVGE